MSFGATSSQIKRMVLLDGYRPVLDGLLFGLSIGLVGRAIARAYTATFTVSVRAGLRGFDAIDDFQVRPRGGFENIGADARSAIGATVVLNGEQCLALCILADRYTVHFERAHLDMNPGGMVDRFDDGVDGSVGGVFMGYDTPIDVREPDRHARRLIVVGGNAKRL